MPQNKKCHVPIIAVTRINTRSDRIKAKISSASHTVPNIGRRKGPAAIQHEEQVVLIIKKQKHKAIWGHCRLRLDSRCKRLFSLRLVSVCGLAAARWLQPLLPFLPPVLCSSLYAAGRMSTWSCQTWTRVHERAWGRKNRLFFFFSSFFFKVYFHAVAQWAAL